jgi:hypothetical protein
MSAPHPLPTTIDSSEVPDAELPKMSFLDHLEELPRA